MCTVFRPLPVRASGGVTTVSSSIKPVREVQSQQADREYAKLSTDHDELHARPAESHS